MSKNHSLILAGHPALIGRHRPFPVSHQAAGNGSQHPGYWRWLRNQNDDLFQAWFSPNCFIFNAHWTHLLAVLAIYFPLLIRGIVALQAHCILSRGRRWIQESKWPCCLSAWCRQMSCCVEKGFVLLLLVFWRSLKWTDFTEWDCSLETDATTDSKRAKFWCIRYLLVP